MHHPPHPTPLGCAGNEIIGGGSFNRAQYATDYQAFRASVTANAPRWAQDIVGPSAAGFPGDDVISPFLTAVSGLDAMSISIHAYSFGERLRVWGAAVRQC